jgi:ferredoxin
MVIEIPSPIPDRCEGCGKCVEVLITSDPNNFDAPAIKSGCRKQACPINARHRPGPVDIVEIYFVECD